MRKLACTIAFLTLTLHSIAQKTQKKFDYAYNLYEMKKYDSALYLFADIYNKGIGNKETIYRSYYFIGLIYLDTKNTAAAKEVYIDMLATDFENPNSIHATSYDLWNNPFSQFKHNSCKILAKLAIDDKDYKLALDYIKMADQEYPFEHFCENAHASNEIYLKRMYAKCYNGLGDRNKAIKTLLPYCLANGYASTSELAAELAVLLKEKYSKENIKKEVKMARAGLYMELPKISYLGPNYYITIFDTKLEVTTTNYRWYRKLDKELKGIELYKYLFDQEEFIKNILQD
jgi:hypothetical protein